MAVQYNSVLITIAPTAAMVAGIASVASLVVTVIRWRREEHRIREAEQIRDA
jgi:hypothetical protein